MYLMLRRIAGFFALLVLQHGPVQAQGALPWCSGYSWQGTALSKQLSETTPRAPSYAELVDSLDANSATSRHADRKSTLIGGSSALKGLTQLTHGRSILPAERAAWQDAQVALNALAPRERAAVFNSEHNSSATIRSADPIADDSVLSNRLKDVELRAKLLQLARSMDPVTLEGHIGNYSDVLKNGLSLSKASEVEVKALTLRTDHWIDNIQSLFGLLNDNSALVGPGNGVRTGGLRNVPVGLPVALGLQGLGEECVRPASKEDMKLDFSTKQIKRAWDPSGFRDVGMLLVYQQSTDGNLSKPKVCSFVRVGGPYVVTAAHCVLASGPGQTLKAHDFGGTSVQAFALIPKDDGSKLAPTACSSNPRSCGYVVKRVTQNPIHPKGITWEKDRAVPQPDLALLPVDFGLDLPRSRTGISANSAKANRLTLAGYGSTSSTAAEFSLGSLLIGWQSIDALTDSKNLIWSVDVNMGAAGACVGDSGGAVFSGDLSGVPKEAHELAGIVSSGKLPTSGSNIVNRCTKADKGVATRLDHHLAWMCSESGNAILGCPANPITRLE